MNPIVENLDNTDQRALPTERGPRGVEIEVQPAPVAPQPIAQRAPQAGSELAQQRLQAAEQNAQRALASTPDVGGIPEAQLTPLSVGNPILDPNTYSTAFTRELQDQVSAYEQLGAGTVPVYAGSTYELPDSTPPANTMMGEFNVSDFARTPAPTPAPAPARGSGRTSGGFLSNAYDQYTDPAYGEQRRLNARGTNLDPTTPALQQAGSGIQGIFSLARRGVSSLFRASKASGAAVVGAPRASDSGATRAAKNVGAFLAGGPATALLNPNARRAYMDTLKKEWSGLGDKEREAVRQLTPTSGAGKAGTLGPLRGDFGEYGTNLLGGVNYVFDGLGNQIRGNIAARVETGNFFNPLPGTARDKEFKAAVRRNAAAAWNGKDFSFLNPDSPITMFDKRNARPNWSTPFRVVGGVVLDTLTGPDPTDVIGWLRQPAGKGAKVLANLPNAPTSVAIVRSTPTPPGSLVRPIIDVDARPYPTALVPGPRGGDLTVQRPSGTSALARDVITVDPYPVPPRLPARGLPGAPELRSLPGTLPRPQLPPAGGVNMSALMTVRPNAPLLNDVRVLPNIPDVGTPDLSPNLPRPRRMFSDELGVALENATADLPTLDLRTGRITPVVEPDLTNVAPPRIASFDDVSRVEWEMPAGQRVNRSPEALGEVNPEQGLFIQGRPDIVGNADATLDIFTKQVREAPAQALEDVDLSRKVLEHSTAAGTTLVTDQGALVRADEFLGAGARQIDDLQNKVSIARSAGQDAVAAQHEAVINAIRGSAKDNPVSPPTRTDVLSSSEVDELVPPVTVAQLTPTRRADQAVRELGSTNLLDQAFDLKAIERSNLVNRSREDLQALAHWMGHFPEDVTPTWNALRKLNEKHGLYAVYGPQVNGFELDRARRNGVRRVEQVERNAILNVPAQSTVIHSTPKVLKNQVHKAAVVEQSLIGQENVLALIQGKALSDESVANLVKTWVNAPGRSSTRRNLNTVLGGGGYQYTPDQIAALKTTYSALPKKEQAKLPKGLRDILKEVLPPTPARVNANEAPSLAELLEPGVSAKELRATAVPSELRDATDNTLVEFVTTRTKALDTRQAIVEVGSDLAMVNAEQSRLYQELASLPELEPRSVMDGNWELGRVNERVETVLEVLDSPVNRRADDPPFSGAVIQRGVSTSAPNTPEQTFVKALFDLDEQLASGNYIPIYEVRAKLGLPRAEFDKLMYKLQSKDIVDIDTLQEVQDYTPAQLAAGIEQPIGGRLFFLSTTDEATNLLANSVTSRADDPFLSADLYYGSPFLGGVGNPRELPLGSSNPLRGAYPPGFAVVTDDPKLARSLAQGRVPDNTVLGQLTVDPAVDKVYLTPDSILLDGNMPLPPLEYERLLAKLSEFIDPVDRDTLREILKNAPNLKNAPLGRIMEHLQEGWAKAYPTKAPNDLLFATLGSGYREYVGRNGDAIVMSLPGDRTVLLIPSPERALAEQFQRTGLDVDNIVPSDAALYRTYADEVLAEGGSTLSKVLGTNNRNQHALELAEELTNELDRLDNELDTALDAESALKSEAFALREQEKLDRAVQTELEQSKNIDDEFNDLFEFTDPGCL